MKKNRTMRVAALLLALTLITSCFVGGTMAKYTSSVTGTSTATVANWDITIKSDDSAMGPTNFKLFDDVERTDDEGKILIAPGDKGVVKLSINSASDVDADWKIEFNVDNNDVPIQYVITDSDTLGGTEIFADTIATIESTIEVDDAEVVKYLHWKWATTSDDDDTDLGEASSLAEVSVAATVTVDQG